MRYRLLLVLAMTVALSCSPAGAPAGPSEQINQSSPATTTVEPLVVAPDTGCVSHPSLSIKLNGRMLDHRDVSGGGHYCGSTADGGRLDWLSAIVVEPGAKVYLSYDTDTRWDFVKFQVLQGDVVVNSGPLEFKTHSAEFALPTNPGNFTVSIQSESGWGQEFTTFNALIK